MTHGTTATLALLMLLLAGCGNPSTDLSSTPSPSSSTLFTSATTTPANTLQTVVYDPYDGHHLRIDERPENATLRVFHTPQQRATFLDKCWRHPGAGTLDGEEWYFLAVWNRTGLVHYEEHPIYPTSKYPIFDRSIQFPPDPPYLVWSTGTCFGPVSIQFHTPRWHRTSDGRGGPMPPDAIDETTRPVVEIRIPAGQLEGDGYLESGNGSLYWVGNPPISGDWEFEGQSFGDVYTYSPDQSKDGEWFMHSWFDLIDSGWEETRGPTATPGTLRFHVKLAAPYPTETVWRGKTWSSSFRDSELERQGFQTPFRLYDDHTSR